MKLSTRIMYFWLAVFISYNTYAQHINKSIPADLCIDEDAYSLYEAINTYRQKLNLDAISLSASLCYLAQMHVQDLAANFDMENAWQSDCGMKSWSDKGHWKAFCYPKDQSGKRDIKDKAKELTPYAGKAWEILYWENNDWAPLADKVLNLWLEIPQSSDMLCNTGKYKSKVWRSIGVAYMNGYVSVFLGTLTDKQKSISKCGSQSIEATETINASAVSTIQIPKNETVDTIGDYHIIVASFSKRTEAEKALNNYLNQGYTKASIIVNGTNSFRISLGVYANAETAAKDLEHIQKQQKDAWILKR